MLVKLKLSICPHDLLKTVTLLLELTLEVLHFILKRQYEILVLTRANNVRQSARLLTFCVTDQSECMKFTMCKQNEWENSTLFYGPCHSLLHFSLQKQQIVRKRYFFTISSGNFLNSI